MNGFCLIEMQVLLFGTEGNLKSDGFVAVQGINLEKAMATHSSTLAWKIPWTEEPGRLQSMDLQRVGHDCLQQ